MELTLIERFTLLQILPEAGNLRTLRVVQDLRMALAPTAQEIKDWHIRDVRDEADPRKGQVVWGWTPEEAAALPTQPDTRCPAEIDVAGVKTEIITGLLRDMDKAGRLTAAHLSLCEKFPFDAKKE